MSAGRLSVQDVIDRHATLVVMQAVYNGLLMKTSRFERLTERDGYFTMNQDVVI